MLVFLFEYVFYNMATAWKGYNVESIQYLYIYDLLLHTDYINYHPLGKLIFTFEFSVWCDAVLLAYCKVNISQNEWTHSLNKHTVYNVIKYGYWLFERKSDRQNTLRKYHIWIVQKMQPVLMIGLKRQSKDVFVYLK